MGKTRQLFLEDSYLKDLATTVTSTTKTSIELESTIFYPEGGGQPTDTGLLDSPQGTSQIVRVEKQGNRIFHIIEGPIPSRTEEVFLRLDWNRRYAHMRMHTAQHIVSRVVFDLYGSQTAGNQIRAEYSHIDFAPASFKATDLPAIEKAVNDLIVQDLPVVIRIVSRDELEQVMGPDRSDLAKLPSSIKQVRLVQIGDMDAYPCAGTHVTKTGEIKGVHIIKRKAKGKGTVRITYELES
jgi:misacylated tRNA(Ala) deacylase